MPGLDNMVQAVCGMMKAPDWVRVGEEQSFRRLKPMPSFGEDSREILQALGYREVEVERFIRLGAVHEFLPALKGKGTYFFDD